MLSTRAVRFCSLLLVGVCLIVAAGARSASSQCCLIPTTETSANVPSERRATTLTAFEMTISDAAGSNFNGRQVQETYGRQGSNSCFYPGGPSPEFPRVSNPQTGAIPWVVGKLYTEVINNGPTNHWGYDFIGVTTNVIDSIRQNGPSNGVTFPCVMTIYQNMWIECDASTTYTYQTDNPLTITIDNNIGIVTNCRRAVLDSTNRCETVNY